MNNGTPLRRLSFTTVIKKLVCFVLLTDCLGGFMGSQSLTFAKWRLWGNEVKIFLSLWSFEISVFLGVKDREHLYVLGMAPVWVLHGVRTAQAEFLGNTGATEKDIYKPGLGIGMCNSIPGESQDQSCLCSDIQNPEQSGLQGETLSQKLYKWIRIAYQVKMITAKPDYLNLIIRTYLVEGENWLPQAVLWVNTQLYSTSPSE